MPERRGVCVWFTGLSGAGKSTITRSLVPMLEARGRDVTVLDTVPEFKKQWCEQTSERKLLSKAVVAREVVRHGGAVICVTVSARHEVRAKARSVIGPDSFVEVFVDTPVEVSAERKRARGKKQPALKKARAFTRRALARVPLRESRGYEPPRSPDLTIDTTLRSADDAAAMLLKLLIDRGFVTPDTVDNAGDDPTSPGPEPGASDVRGR